MERNIVTLQLTVPALEKLFEGDPEVVLKMRQAAVAEFAKRKISQLLDAASKADIEHAITTMVGKIEGSSYAPKITLQKPILELIQAETKKALFTMDGIVRDVVNQEIESMKDGLNAKVEAEVRRRVTTEITDRVRNEVRTKMDGIIKAAQV